MIFAVDIGNTNTVIGIFKDDKLAYSFRLDSDQKKTTDEYAAVIMLLMEKKGFKIEDIRGVIISSVVPALVYTFSKIAAKYLNTEALVIGPGVKTGISIKMENPKEVGADRIVNSVAAKVLYGVPSLIVDFGTATTIDTVNERGEYIGGVICPGVKLSVEMLKSNTAKLPAVEIEKPETVTGKSTIHSIKSGIYYGYLSMVDGLIHRIIQENFSGDKPVNIIATGGLGRYFMSDSVFIKHYEPDLTLLGLKFIYEKNV